MPVGKARLDDAQREEGHPQVIGLVAADDQTKAAENELFE